MRFSTGRHGIFILLAGCHASPTATPPQSTMSSPSRISALTTDANTGPRIVRSPHAIFEDIDALEGGPVPQTLEKELDDLRHNARLAALGEEHARVVYMDARTASEELQARARSAKSIHEFVHPQRGLFVLSHFSDGIRLTSLDRFSSWVTIDRNGFGANIDGQKLLEALRSAASLPTDVEYTDDDCGFTLDAVTRAEWSLFDGWAHGTNLSVGDPVDDGYALRPWAHIREYVHGEDGTGMSRETFEAMQLSAHAVTHKVYWDTQEFDFGRIDGTWYLLGVSILVDINEAC